MSKGKTSKAFVLFLMFAMVFSLVALPAAIAHDPPWEIPTTAMLSVAPNPVGVGQQVIIVMWLDRTVQGTGFTNDLRMHGYKLTITKPDDTTEVKTWDMIVDTTSSQYTLYTPDQVGIYKLKFEFPGMDWMWGGTYENDTYLPSSREITLAVQEEQLPEALTSYPLPTEYWTRPIEGHNTWWDKISSNWLGGGDPLLARSYTRKIQPFGPAPNSAHIMWTKPIQDGGVVGGDTFIREGQVFYPGLTYNRRFGSEIIMYGRLYYQEPLGNSGSGGDVVCVDLRTGEEIFRSSEMTRPSFGYYWEMDHVNQHGIVGEGWLFTSNFATAYEPGSGKPVPLNLTMVPSGTAVKGEYGEHLRYVMDYNNRLLVQWNSSRVFRESRSGFYPANCPITPERPSSRYWNGTDWVTSSERNAQGYASVTSPAYDWNVSIPDLPGLSSPTIIAGNYNDMIFGRSTSYPSSLAPQSWGTNQPITHWAISTKAESAGQLLWIKNYTFPEADKYTYLFTTVDFESRVFVIWVKETRQMYGYDLDDGSLLWGPTESTLSDWDYYEPETTLIAYNKKVYYSNFGGILYCWDARTGDLEWTYGNGGEGNSTYGGFQVAYGHYPIQPEVAADGKIYLTTTEHSPSTPLFKGARLICVNATDGTELWSILNFGATYGGFAPQAAIADGFLVTLNQYDYQIYCYGKGPSSTAVSIQNDVTTHGKTVLVKGSVIDIAAGTKQAEQAARFPSGVPAVSDESQSAWMEYVYMQKPKPTDVTGVEVVLSVLDPNGNCYEVGRATTDASGMFSCDFIPEVPGKYTVVAAFEGSESYWGSYSETALYIEEAPQPTPAPPPEPASMADIYILPGIIGIIIAIVVVGLIVILLLCRKR